MAQIGAAHGLKGEVRLWPFTEDPMTVAGYGALQSEDGSREIEIESLRAAKDHFVAKLSGVSDRNAADALRNVKLYIARDRLPDIEEEDTFYHSDLIGLAAVTKEGVGIGEVIALHNFGAGDIVEIRLPDGKTAMLPFTDTVVPTIDLDAKKIVVDPPEGALEG